MCVDRANSSLRTGKAMVATVPWGQSSFFNTLVFGAATDMQVTGNLKVNHLLSLAIECGRTLGKSIRVYRSALQQAEKPSSPGSWHSPGGYQERIDVRQVIPADQEPEPVWF